MFTTEPARLRTVHFHPCWVLGTFTSFGPVLAQFIVVRTDICKRSNTDSSRSMANSCEELCLLVQQTFLCVTLHQNTWCERVIYSYKFMLYQNQFTNYFYFVSQKHFFFRNFGVWLPVVPCMQQDSLFTTSASDCYHSIITHLC
jgi:hypothetical protein